MSSTPLKIAILGRKIGMTRFFLEDGKNIPVTVIEAGSAFNVIPDRATLKGTLRSLSEETRCLVERRVERIARGIAQLKQLVARQGADASRRLSGGAR